MGNHPMSDYARQLCEKHASLSSNAISRALIKKYPMPLDDARSIVRRVRGQKHNGIGGINKNVVPYIPPSIAKDYTPFILEGRSIGVMSDIHIPYHSVKAIECAVEYLKKEKCDVILLNGDIWDCFMLSTFDKDTRGADSVKEELGKVAGFLDYIHAQFPKARIVYREGNHEYRLERFLMAQALALLDMDEFHLPELLNFGKRGIQWVNEKRVIRVGDLSILHGHELASGISAPVNPARGLFLKFKASAMMGHSHQTAEHTEKTGLGEVISCWAVACLSDLYPRYRPINPYNHGYAHIRVYKADDFHVSNRRIIDGKQV